MEENVINYEEILEFLHERQFVRLRNALNELNPVDIAPFFGMIEEREIPLVYRLLPKELASEVFAYMETEEQELLIRSFTDTELGEVINDLYLDDTVDIIEEMPANVVARVLQSATPTVRKQINELLKYPEDSAGSIMTIEYVSLDKNYTVAEAFKKIRREGIDKETVNTCYVTEKRKLLGSVTILDMILAGDDTVISDIMDTGVISVDAYEDKEFVAKQFSKYDTTALPVVDKDGRIVGIVTVDDAMDVMEDEATEDIEKMAAIIPNDKPYLKTGVLSIWMKRIPWLMLLMVSATFTGGIINSFEGALTAFPALVAFIPMIMDTGGNAGGQASVTVIRGLAIGEVQIGDVFRVLWKELRVALLCGITLAATGFLKIILVDNLLMHRSINFVSFAEIGIVCATLVVTVIIAKIIGCSLPMAAKKLGLDPAVMASPFITTIVDAVSLAVYFAIATRVLSF